MQRNRDKTTEGSFQFVSTNPHHHEANPAKKELVQTEKEKKGGLHEAQNHQQLSHRCQPKTQLPVARMASHRRMVRRIQREKVVAHIHNLLSTTVLNIPAELKATIGGEAFYTFDSGKKDPNRFIIFRTTQNLDEPHFSGKWAVDGTFAVCPSLFNRLYKVHTKVTIFKTYRFSATRTKQRQKTN